MNTRIEKQIQVDAIRETSTFALSVGIVSAALIGIWGAVCLISALSSNGPVNLIKGFISTIVGS